MVTTIVKSKEEKKLWSGAIIYLNIGTFQFRYC